MSRLGWLLFFVFAPTAAAQPVRVKPEVAKRHWLTGEVVTRGSDSLIVIQYAGAARDTVPMYDFALVEVYRGRRISPPRVVLCTLGGMLLGLVAAGILIEDSAEFVPAAPVIYGLGIGGGVGLAVGLIPQPSWKLVYASPEGKQWIDDRRPWPTP